MYEKLEEKLGYKFNKTKLLIQAFRHTSSCENIRLMSNERLEFLGDAVLELAITEILFNTYKDANEGELSILRSKLVSKRALSKIAFKLKLKDYLTVGKSIDKSNYKNKYITSVVEALIGAIYLDSNFLITKKIIKKLWNSLIKSVKYTQNYKNILQQKRQKEKKSLPVYKTTKTYGTKNSPIFEVTLFLDGESITKGKAKTKKIAEQIAALKYLKKCHLI